MSKVRGYLRTKSTVSIVVAKNNVDRTGELLAQLGDHERRTQIAGVDQVSCLLNSGLLQSLSQVIQTVMAIGEKSYPRVERQRLPT